MISYILQHFVAINWTLIAVTLFFTILFLVFDMKAKYSAIGWAIAGAYTFAVAAEGMSIWAVVVDSGSGMFISQLTIASVILLILLATAVLFWMAKPHHGPAVE